jgi:septal ring factor EnvC (AmiA/AmiB activator)
MSYDADAEAGAGEPTVADEPSRFTPTAIISAFGLSIVSALIYAGVTMQRINQLETADDRVADQLQQMADSRYQKQAEFEAKIAHLEKTDAARTEELKGIHSELDRNAGRIEAAGVQIMDKLDKLEQSLNALRYGSAGPGAPR